VGTWKSQQCRVREIGTNSPVVKTGPVELRYVDVTVWPDGIPHAEIEGDGRKPTRI
jgi:hypothetical protein